jgi:hypothetical protein
VLVLVLVLVLVAIRGGDNFGRPAVSVQMQVT